MDTLLFAGFSVVLVAGTLSAVFYITRPKPGRPKLVLLGVTGGKEEAHLWVEKLRMVGINAHVRNVGDTLQSTSPYGYEVWVRYKDEERARKSLGL